MAPFVFRCPYKNAHVQGWTADDPSEEDDIYSPVQCGACGQMHYVIPATGKVLGSDDDDE
jgi:hypothetical protein